MKGLKVILLLLFLSTTVVAVSQTTLVWETFSSPSLGKWMPVSGSWKIRDGKLVQTDTNEKMAMITIPVRQTGTILYEFDFEYVTGGEDDYAGFGIHICVNDPSKVRSWGNGQSMLAWITWDPGTYGYPGGFIQVYESKGLTDMGLYTGIYPSPDPLMYGDLIPINEEYINIEYIYYTVPVRLLIDTRTGKGKFYDPFDPEAYYYPFDLGAPIKPGDYFTFRTNSVSVAIDNLRITRID
ncbi:MAG: hypothetical protein ACUVWJ_01060 [Spirochaetota bacterium]